MNTTKQLGAGKSFLEKGWQEHLINHNFRPSVLVMIMTMAIMAL